LLGQAHYQKTNTGIPGRSSGIKTDNLKFRKRLRHLRMSQENLLPIYLEIHNNSSGAVSTPATPFNNSKKRLEITRQNRGIIRKKTRRQ